mgnify:CR=1 FL=1
MIELFCRSDFKLKNARLCNNDKSTFICHFKAEYIILFKAKAYLDLQKRKDLGEKVDSSDIKKHKKDVLRIASELMLEKQKNCR